MHIIDLDARAVRASAELVATATAADLSKPTPCLGWTLYGLLAHVTTQHYGFAAASRGDADPATWKLLSLGDDPVRAYLDSADHVIAAFAADGVAERGFPLPEFRPEPFPAEQAVGFHLVDYVVHSWDVAKTLGADLAFDDDVLDAAHAVAAVVPTGPVRLAPGAAFGPVVPWEGGSRLDQLVAYLGRSPAWPA
ncbi:TIGR03086 family metal-binding protein [Jiangella sp. DSM 45060]|uniref:TIGR03086 family metal-binding protein n=1 Tax=Jiangella sp. DSM 45060 TaxID=1798224 RepID=UPI00087D9A86|nr:TIGR03086 family metal-binding protein [Jiangella sp. DSM 45060]SDS59799.1 TIGR03086 family protein [Jiangella sp. DSM 45060]